MEFISAEEFLRQPKEIQEVLIEWWKPSLGDLATNRHSNLSVLKENRDIEAVKIYKGQPYAIPLFTECQLRKFIEDKANGVIKVIQWHVEDNEISKRGYSIDILRKKEYHVLYHYKNLGDDLLQAYWKVALKVAKESVENEYK